MVHMIQILHRVLLKRSCFLSSLQRLHNSVFQMAQSKFEYVKSFENEGLLDPRHWIVIALNLKNYDEIYNLHDLQKPNDHRLTKLMEASVKTVMEDFKEVVLHYGFSGEAHFVFSKNTTLYRRRGPKLLTNLCSLMTAAFVYKWQGFFGSVTLDISPLVEGTIHLLPDDQALRDYLTRCQNVCHHQNLYKTVFWTLVLKEGLLPDEASRTLKGANEGVLNEILFTMCNMNYNKEEDVFKKGSVTLRKKVQKSVTTQDGSITQRAQSSIINMYTDLVRDNFWNDMFVLEKHTKVNGKVSYLKSFEKQENILPHTWMVVRIDGKGFHRFSEKHSFEKPNDLRSIELMNKAALSVMKQFPDIIFSYGQSDEYSFVIHRYSKMLDRQGYRIISSIVSLFAAVYVSNWQNAFGDVVLQYCPAFDARVVQYPNNSCLRDYLSWRQADCHINNMYNTCFWTLVQSGHCSRQKAEEILCGTFSKDKRAILMTRFQRDYNQEEAIYRKGTIMFRENPALSDSALHVHDTGTCGAYTMHGAKGEEAEKRKCGNIIVDHIDVIKEEFWTQRPWILGTEKNATTLDEFD